MNQIRIKFSVNVHPVIHRAVAQAAFDEQVSRSVIIEIALRELFRRVPPDRRSRFLLENGASLRRKTQGD